MNTKSSVLMWRYSAMAVGLYALLWYVILPIFMTLPADVGPIVDEGGNVLFAFPVAISRWWDMVGVALFVSAIMYAIRAVAAVAGQDEVLGYLIFGLFGGLIFGLGGGLVDSLILGLGVGLIFGLFGGLAFSLAIGLALGLGAGLILVIGWGFSMGVTYGMPYGVGLSLAGVVVNGLMFLILVMLRGFFADLGGALSSVFSRETLRSFLRGPEQKTE